MPQKQGPRLKNKPINLDQIIFLVKKKSRVEKLPSSKSTIQTLEKGVKYAQS